MHPRATKLPLRLDQDWPGVTAICRIERIREMKDHCSREAIYAITSLPADKLDQARLLQHSRDHWAIENSLFHVHDVTFRENRVRSRLGTAGPGRHPRRRAQLRWPRQWYSSHTASNASCNAWTSVVPPSPLT